MATLPLAVRWLHVLGTALLLGGSVVTWWTLSRAATTGTTEPALATADTYERLFWAATGVVVVTGVGNLGALAPALPRRGPWAVALAAKLVAVVGLLVVSAVRTLLVHRLDGGRRGVADALEPVRAGYAATVLLLVGILALAEVLAHG